MNAEEKKRLVNEYKSKPVTGGVYCIECSGNHRRWIKSTTDLEGIANRFKFAVETGGCPEPSMLREWKEYGVSSFSLIVLEELKKKEDSTAREFADDITALYELWLEKDGAEK